MLNLLVTIRNEDKKLHDNIMSGVWQDYSYSSVKIPLIAGTALELYKLQRKDEINLSVIVKNYNDQQISSEDPNRITFTDYAYAVETSVSKRGILERVKIQSRLMRKYKKNCFHSVYKRQDSRLQTISQCL